MKRMNFFTKCYMSMSKFIKVKLMDLVQEVQEIYLKSRGERWKNNWCSLWTKSRIQARSPEINNGFNLIKMHKQFKNSKKYSMQTKLGKNTDLTKKC